MESDYKAGSTLRDAHPKALGVMKGTLTVADDVPPDLRIGIFAQAGASFGCWLRSSSAKGNVQSDAVPDLRGMAI